MTRRDDIKRFIEKLRTASESYGRGFITILSIESGVSAPYIGQLINNDQYGKVPMPKTIAAIDAAIKKILPEETSQSNIQPQESETMNHELVEALREIIRLQRNENASLQREVAEFKAQLREEENGPADSLPTGTR